MSRVRFGIVGMGQRGRLGWIRNLQLSDETAVVAVCDKIAPLAREGATQAGIGEENAYRDLDLLLARDDVDAVAIVVEPEHQAEIAVRALEAGKHVICEVPLAYSLEDCWRIVLAVERTGRTLALAEQGSYAPFTLAWRRLLDEGLLGRIIYAEAQYFHAPDDSYLGWWIDAETGRGLSWEEAARNPNARKNRAWTLTHPIWYSPHSLGPLLRLLDDRVVTVTCMSTRRRSYYHEAVPLPDVEVALMHTERDTILRIANGFVVPGPEPWHWFHLLGTLGEVETGRRRAEGDPTQGAGSLLWLANHHMRSRSEVDWGLNPFQPGMRRRLASGHGGLDYAPVEDFVRSILDGRPPTIDVYRAAEIAGPAAVAGLSAERGFVPLPVPDFRPGPQRPIGQPPASEPSTAALAGDRN